jgi:peptidoglycan/LPS O-acetylase OafA/YrhL
MVTGMSERSETRLGYVPALDGLRAVAIVLVVSFHAMPGFRFGMLGVDVFFVLSGFLITSLIAERIQSGDFSRRRFYLRRAIRLVPALVVTVVVLTPLGVVVMKGEPTLLAAVAALLYLSPLVPLNIFRVTWTLAIEEWFYLLWPVVLGKFFRDRLTLRQAAALVGTLAIAVQATMVLGPGSIAARPSALLAGAALALWWLDGARFRHQTLLLVFGLAALFVGAFAGPLLYGPLPFWLAVSGSVAIVGALASGAAGVVRRWLELAPMVAVGVVSYEWYLLHDAMLRMSAEVWGVGSFWLVAPASLALAFGLHHALVPLQTRLRARLDDRPVIRAV